MRYVAFLLCFLPVAAMADELPPTGVFGVPSSGGAPTQPTPPTPPPHIVQRPDYSQQGNAAAFAQLGMMLAEAHAQIAALQTQINELQAAKAK